MYLQGNLQIVFDALYEMGVIEPVLKMDWKNALSEMHSCPDDFFRVVQIVNKNQTDSKKLMTQLESFNEKTLGYLAMEVAREYADFHSREEVH
jgi:hypothetical protein